MAINIARHDERLQALEHWQQVQNGHLNDIDRKLDALRMWLIGLMGGVCVSLLLLVINLALGLGAR